MAVENGVADDGVIFVSAEGGANRGAIVRTAPQVDVETHIHIHPFYVLMGEFVSF